MREKCWWKVCTVGTVPENDGVLIQNNGSTVVYLGASTVTADATATGGMQVAAGATVTVPTTGAESLELYGIVASGTADVAFLFPG